MPHTEVASIRAACSNCDWDADHQPPELMRLAAEQHVARTAHQVKVTTTTVEVMA